MRNLILGADIVYIGGGNTLAMMKRWRELGIDKLLKIAYKRDIVLSGLSAGSICWFKQGLSDSRRFRNPKADLIKVTGIGLINIKSRGALIGAKIDLKSTVNSGTKLYISCPK